MKVGSREKFRFIGYFSTVLLGISFLFGGLGGCAPNSFPKESLAFVHPGETTRAEVIENFSTPTYDLKEPHVIAYLKDTIGGAAPHSTLDRTIDPKLFQDDPGQSGRETELLCFLLDEQDRVQRFGRIIVDGKTQPKAAIIEWAKGGRVGK